MPSERVSLQLIYEREGKDELYQEPLARIKSRPLLELAADSACRDSERDPNEAKRLKHVLKQLLPGFDR